MRADLLALTTDALAALTNRGLVRRAAKEAGPSVVENSDGTVVGTSVDGTVTTIPVGGGLDAAGCTCAATGICRHVLAVVLAYRRDAGSTTEAAATRWSPGIFTDDDLAARLGGRLLAAARRAARTGYVARVVRPTADDPAPRVELGSCTVRFLVPGDLGFTHTDAATGARDDVIALAVWAFRVADEQFPDAMSAQVQVGGAAAADEAGSAALADAVALADEVLRTGAVHAGAGFAGPIAALRRTLDAAGLRWPLLAVDDLAGQLTAYADRSTGHRPDLLADVITELHARHRAAGSGARAAGTGLPARILGTGEVAQTPLRRVRLDGLGCRIGGDDTGRVVEIFLAHADSATVLVVRQRFAVTAADERVGGRRVGGATVAALAAGTVVTASAVRSASRTVRLGAGTLAKTTVDPSSGEWERLPPGLVVRDLMAFAAELDELPPRFVRARVEAEFVRVVEIAEVRDLTYSAGAQRLDAVIADRSGWTGLVSSTYRPTAPGSLDALARALGGEYGRPRFVSGSLRRQAGAVVVDPLAVAVDGRVVVPDLAVDGWAVAVGPAPAPAGGGIDRAADGAVDLAVDRAVDSALSVLAEAAHRGLDHLPASYGERLRAVARELSAAGLRRAAHSVEAFAATPDSPDAWVDAYLRLSVTSDLR